MVEFGCQKVDREILTKVNSSGTQLTPVRPDRDDFIQLHEENIAPEKAKNFEKRPYGDAEFHTTGSVDHGRTPYDVLSVISGESSWSYEFEKYPDFSGKLENFHWIRSNMVSRTLFL